MGEGKKERVYESCGIGTGVNGVVWSGGIGAKKYTF